jgi:hypothetical protein
MKANARITLLRDKKRANGLLLVDERDKVLITKKRSHGIWKRDFCVVMDLQTKLGKNHSDHDCVKDYVEDPFKGSINLRRVFNGCGE